MKENYIKGALLGLSVGDALGVPVEFLSRDQLRMDPVKGMRAFGSWNQPPGTWSDDSSLSFCLAESLCNGYELMDIGDKFTKWYKEEYWTAHNEVFDVGNTTANAIVRLLDGISPELSGDFDEFSNGNGSLMRILPLVFYCLDKPIKERYRLAKEVSSITHSHFRSVFSCFIYLEFARCILKGLNKQEAYLAMQSEVEEFLRTKSFNDKETNLFYRVLYYNISELQVSDISSSGYVIHSLEASLWCVLTSSSYPETVLKAVNLGGDTDTIAAIAGGLAGWIYGVDGIPEEWINGLARKEDIILLAGQLKMSLVKE